MLGVPLTGIYTGIVRDCVVVCVHAHTGFWCILYSGKSGRSCLAAAGLKLPAQQLEWSPTQVSSEVWKVEPELWTHLQPPPPFPQTSVKKKKKKKSTLHYSKFSCCSCHCDSWGAGVVGGGGGGGWDQPQTEVIPVEKLGILVAALPDALSYGVIAQTGWSSVSMLWLNKIASLMGTFCLHLAAHNNVLSRFVPAVHFACCWHVKRARNERELMLFHGHKFACMCFWHTLGLQCSV